jgi:hypothetical protein
MPDWRCPRCGAVNLAGQASCEGCGDVSRRPPPRRRRARPGRRASPSSAPLLTVARPDPEQSLAAIRIYRAVAAGELDAAEGRRRLAALFGDPDLERSPE